MIEHLERNSAWLEELNTNWIKRRIDTNLPLKEIKALEISNSETIKGWLDKKTLLICGWRAETVRYQSEDGTFKYKMEIIKTEPERKIVVNSD